jgi:hypothetical protein
LRWTTREWTYARLVDCVIREDEDEDGNDGKISIMV